MRKSRCSACTVKSSPLTYLQFSALIQTPVKECHQYATVTDPGKLRKPAEPNSPALDITNLNQNLPLNSSQNRLWLLSVCAAASVETNLLHFGAWAVWDGVDSVTSVIGAVPIKAAWCYPAARLHFNPSKSSWLLPEYLGCMQRLPEVWDWPEMEIYRGPRYKAAFLFFYKMRKLEPPLCLPPLALPQTQISASFFIIPIDIFTVNLLKWCHS